MFLLGDQFCWSASDLTQAAECEYSLLPHSTTSWGQADPIDAPRDVLQEHIARLEIATRPCCCKSGARLVMSSSWHTCRRRSA